MVSIILVLLILTVSTTIAYQSERREMRRVPETVAVGAADGISGFFGFLEDTLKLTAGIVERQGTFVTGENQVTQTILDKNIALLELRLYNADGIEIDRVLDTVLAASVAEDTPEQFFEYVDTIARTRSSQLFEPSVSRYNTAYAVWGFPVVQSTTGEQQVMLALVDVSSLWGALAGIGQARQGDFYIVDKSGEILVASSFDLIDNRASAADIEIVADYQIDRKVTRVYEGIRGERVFGTWESINPTEWALVVEFSAAALSQDISRSVLVFIIFILVLVGFFAYEAVIVQRVLLQPLQQLVALIEGFKAGNLRDRADGIPDNELGELADTFNHMADKLEAAYTGLEGKVREKTKELRFALSEVESQARELKEDKVHDEAVFDSIADGLVVVDKDRRVINMNQSALDLLGGTNTDYQNQLWPDIVNLRRDDGEIVPEDEIPVIRALRYQETVTILPVFTQFTFTDKAGQVFPVSMTAAPVLLDNGQTLGAVVAFRNVTAEKEIDRQKNEFISFTSHQLRTPLTNIKWLIELLLKGSYDPLSEKQEQVVQNLDEVTKKMIGLVAALLNLSRLELGTVVTKPDAVDIPKLVREVVSEFDREVREKGLDLVQDTESAPNNFSTDGKLLQVVIQNLVSNAVKYTETGSISIVVRKRDDLLEIKVQDTGYGIPADVHQKIFTKLFRANSTSKRAQGTGIGLYMTKSIVGLLGGEITFESTEGKGTTFTVILPPVTVQSEQKKPLV